MVHSGTQFPGALLTISDLKSSQSRPDLESAIRSRCQAANIDQYTILCRILGRFKFCVDSRDIGFSPHLILDGYWEMWCTEFMLRHVKNGHVVIDVGANLGYYTILLSDLVGPEGRVTAVEPSPRLAELCQHNIDLNGFRHTAKLRRQAASDTTGALLRFQALISDPKNGHILPDTAPDNTTAHVLDTTVETIRLDDLVEGPVDFIKIDVEGAEEQVWAGMQQLLHRSPDVIVLMEFNTLRCTHPEQTLAAMAGHFPLRELGFDGTARHLDAATVLGRSEDTLLILSHREL